MSDKKIGPMGSCLKCSAPLYFLGSYCNQKCEDAITIAFTNKPDTVTISREDLSALLLNYEWFLTRFEGAMDFDPRVVSGKLTKALEVQGE